MQENILNLYKTIQGRYNRLGYKLEKHELLSLVEQVPPLSRSDAWLSAGIIILLCKPEHRILGTGAREGFDCLAVWSWCVQVANVFMAGMCPDVYYDGSRSFSFYSDVGGAYVFRDSNLKNMLSFYNISHKQKCITFKKARIDYCLSEVDEPTRSGTFAVDYRYDSAGILRGHIKTLIYKEGNNEIWLNGTTNGKTTWISNFDFGIKSDLIQIKKDINSERTKFFVII